ncbi:MAG: 50S ribosomal protein L17 [Candidatus Caenarcaniphilales bacterium]|nr:50S ribosomal protein L17 [Candidatus Caenarcaniphilales bacterium]
MRHGLKRNTLGRAKDQQKALLRSLSRELIINGHIQTTLTKAKVLRPFIEKIITKAKKSLAASDPAHKLHYIRLIRKDLASDIVSSLLDRAKPLADRQGGYTRIIKTIKRRGDSTQMSIIQILDN